MSSWTGCTSTSDANPCNRCTNMSFETAIGAFNKRFAGARPVQPIMFGDQVAPDSLAHLRHALDGFDPLVLAGVAERGRAAQDLLSHTFRCGPDGGQQRLPLLTLIQLTACQSRKRKAHESCREDC